MKSLAVTPRDHQQQKAQYQKRDDPVKLLQHGNINQHHLDDGESEQNQGRPAQGCSAANETVEPR